MGYSPITVKIIEKAVKGGWSKIINALDDLPGETYFPENEKGIINPIGKNFILLVFIGGITYSEIAGIRCLNNQLKNFLNHKNLNNKIKFHKNELDCNYFHSKYLEHLKECL